MDIEYDSDKSHWTFRERGFDFDYAARIFEGTIFEAPSPRDSEERFLAIGCVDDTLLAVIYTWRGRRRRIISARPASKAEADVYRSQDPGTDPP
jgi:hypothetical protein